MSKTSIGWTELTWNPTTGCNKISAGCRFCYAETMHRRLRAMGQKKYQQEFSKGVVTHPEDLNYPLEIKKPSMFFVNSMSDLFHADVPFVFIDDVFATMDACSPNPSHLPIIRAGKINGNHTFQVLTKRADRMLEYYNWKKAGNGFQFNTWPLPNVWQGVSVEDQERADERIPLLLQVPATVRFLSCEPLIGPIDLTEIKLPHDIDDRGFSVNCLTSHDDEHFFNHHPQIHWVIAGGESGNKKGVRPMHPNWVRSLRDQCATANVPFLFKQWGEWAPFYKLGHQPKSKWVREEDGKTFADLKGYEGYFQRMYPVGKAKSGNLLDGKQHLEFPITQTQPA
jgi:protein gp37